MNINVTDKKVKEKIVEIFQQERHKRNAEFVSPHVLDFLTYPAHKKKVSKTHLEELDDIIDSWTNPNLNLVYAFQCPA
jgi:hypothetical protein